MTITMITFTNTAKNLAEKIAGSLKEDAVILFDGRKGKEEQDLDAWLKLCFEKKHCICFISACGIAVRKIAPYVQNKLSDSPVIVIDELGQFVIPVLSGHVGGANDIGRMLANFLNATPVITTATDIHDKFAIDVFAKKSGLTIVNKEGIALVSGKILEGKTITVQVDKTIEDLYEVQNNLFTIGGYTWEIPKAMTRVSSIEDIEADVFIGRYLADHKAKLLLKPKEYVLGIGCRKGKSYESLFPFVTDSLAEKQLSIHDIQAIVSIDQKKEEKGILDLAQSCRIPFYTYAREDLATLQGDFTASEFVKSQMGVDNVCERACMAYCKEQGERIIPKKAQDGMTLAVYQCKCEKMIKQYN